MVALTPSGIGRRRRPAPPLAGGVALALAIVILAIALAWSFAAAGGLRPAARTESTCEQLWTDGRYTADLAGADHDAFIAACLAR